MTSQLLDAFLKCPTKCHLRSVGEMASGNTYADWLTERCGIYRDEAARRLQKQLQLQSAEILAAPLPTDDLNSAKWRLALNVPIRSGSMESRLDALQRIPSESTGKPTEFIPVRFVFSNKLTKHDRLLLAFDALVLSKALGREVGVGAIVHRDDYAMLKIRISGLLGDTRKVGGRMAALLAAGSTPDLVLNRHCADCEFQSRCRQKAVEKDDLSLLAMMTEKERKRLNNKGLFTVTQLSYTFRPRRRPKRLREKRERYHHALKALAIRQQQIHIVGQPQLSIEGTPVYLDVESLPDRDFYYLIGVRVRIPDSIVQRSFWANDPKAEENIWIDFLSMLATIENPILIHYGSFETTFLKRMTERYGGPLDGSAAAKSIKSPLNLATLLFGQVYLPTYSNRLKDVGAWLGFRWSIATASGTESIMWRMAWEQSGDPNTKQNLITYNLEDCHALNVLAETVARICRPPDDNQPKSEDEATPRVVVADSSTSRDGLWRRFSSLNFHGTEFG